MENIDFLDKYLGQPSYSYLFDWSVSNDVWIRSYDLEKQDTE